MISQDKPSQQEYIVTEKQLIFFEASGFFDRRKEVTNAIRSRPYINTTSELNKMLDELINWIKKFDCYAYEDDFKPPLVIRKIKEIFKREE